LLTLQLSKAGQCSNKTIRAQRTFQHAVVSRPTPNLSLIFTDAKAVVACA